MANPHQAWPTLADAAPADRKGDDATDRQANAVLERVASAGNAEAAPGKWHRAKVEEPPVIAAPAGAPVGQGNVEIFPARMTITRAPQPQEKPA